MSTSLQSRSQRLLTISLLPAILILAAALRFAGLSQRGLLYWDEGKFALEGIRFLEILGSLPHLQGIALSGKAVGTAKPTHALLIALSYAILGIHDYAPLALNAACSVAAVAVLFILARRLFDWRVALVSAVFLAISGYDTIYARSALSESDANLVFLLGVLLWWRGRRAGAAAPWTLAAALVLGAGFTVNYRLSIYIAVVAGIDLILTWRRAGRRRAGVEAAAWTTGLLTAPLVWEVIGLLAASHGIVLFRSEITYRPTTYFAEVLYQIHEGRQSTVQFDPLPYVQWYVVRQGWPLTVLLLAGLVYAARERSLRWLIPAALVLIPYAAYSFAPLIVPRNLEPTLPFTALLAAGGAVRLAERIAVRRLMAPVLTLLVLLTVSLEADRAWALTGVRSGFVQAATYLRQQGSEGAVVVNEVMMFYLRDPGRGCDAPQLPSPGDSVSTTLAADLRAGNRYAVIDSYAIPISWYLLHHAHPVRHYPTLGWSSPGENLIASENGFPPVHQSGEWVDIYALRGLHLDADGTAPPVSCSLDRLA